MTLKIVHFFALVTLVSLKSNSQNNALDFGPVNSLGIGASVTIAYSPALDFSINDKFTIEAWVKVYGGGNAVIFSNQQSVYPYRGYALSISTGGKLNFVFTSDYLSDKLEVEQLLNVNDGYWHHVAVAYNGNPGASNLKLYLDGLDLITNGLANSLSGVTTTGNAPYIGRGYILDTYFQGRIDELRIWNEAKCKAEINASMNCQLSGNEPNLVAYYNFNQGVANGNNPGINTLLDSGPNSLNGALSNFYLNGTSSNWVASNSAISGVCIAGPFPVSVSGNSVSCSGDLVSLTLNGAQSSTVFPGNISFGSEVSFSPSVTTNYTIQATASNNCDGTVYHTQVVNACVGLQDIIAYQNGNSLEIVPNPSNGYFKLSGLKPNSEVYIYSMCGELVFKTRSQNEFAEISLADFTKGIYFIRCLSQNFQAKKTLLIE